MSHTQCLCTDRCDEEKCGMVENLQLSPPWLWVKCKVAEPVLTEPIQNLKTFVGFCMHEYFIISDPVENFFCGTSEMLQLRKSSCGRLVLLTQSVSDINGLCSNTAYRVLSGQGLSTAIGSLTCVSLWHFGSCVCDFLLLLEPHHGETDSRNKIISVCNLDLTHNT